MISQILVRILNWRTQVKFQYRGQSSAATHLLNNSNLDVHKQNLGPLLKRRTLLEA